VFGCENEILENNMGWEVSIDKICGNKIAKF